MKNEVLVALTEKWKNEAEPKVDNECMEDSEEGRSRYAAKQAYRNALRRCAADINVLIGLID